MAKKSVKILAVGGIKTTYWKDAIKYYQQRLNHWRDVQEINVKDGDSALPSPERNKWEGQRLIQALQPSDYVICLDEKGKSFTSQEFAKFLEKNSENATKTPCFVIGGAFGLDQEVRDKANFLMSLGPMTFPHELARVLIYEQLYRAEAILRGVPYHH